MRALIPLARGFEEIEALTAVDVLRRGGVEVVLASIHGGLEVVGAHGIRVRADALFADVADDAFEALVLPGGGEGTENLRASEEVLDRVRRQMDEESLIAAICAAPLVLVTAGVLPPDLEVTCYPSCQLELDRPWSHERVVQHGNIITAQGPGTSLLFALVVLKTLMGEEVSARTARMMVADCL